MTDEEIILMSEEADTYADTKLGTGEYHPDWHDVRDLYFARLVADKVLTDAAIECRAGYAPDVLTDLAERIRERKT